jgi:transketolase
MVDWFLRKVIMEEMRATREAFGEALVELGHEHKNIVVLDADLSKSTTTEKFEKLFPERFFDCGVAEQSMMGIAAGLALSGKICYTGSFAIFNERAFEHIRNSIAYQNLNVKLCPTHAGITVGEDGSTHQSVEDIAIMRAIPNMKVVAPADFHEAKAAIKVVAQIEGPIFIRLSRAPFPLIFDENYKFQLGKSVKLRVGQDVTIFAIGLMVKKSLEAAEILKKDNIDVGVVNASSIKPLDKNSIIKSVKETDCAVTVEEHSIIGGLGGAISELLSEEMPAPIVKVGIRDRFGQSGTPDELLVEYGLTVDDIVKAVKKAIKLKEVVSKVVR